MADPLSISASIVAILQLTSTVVQYINKVDDASKERARIRDEISSTSFLLYMLKDRAQQAKSSEPWLSTIQSLDMPNGPLKTFKTALEHLALRLESSKRLKKVGKALKWPFQREEIKEILSTIERQKSLFGLALQDDHIDLSRAIKEDITRLDNGIAELQTEQRAFFKDNIRQKIHSWLSPSDPASNHNFACKKHQATTGSWFVDGPQFEEWEITPNSFLWLHGISGCGKTILCSTIIQKIMHCYKADPSVLVVYFYFDFNDAQKQSHENLIRSLIVQLSMQSQNTPEALDSLFNQNQGGKQQPKSDELALTLQDMQRDSHQTFIILDALDECQEREALLALIRSIFDLKLETLHFLATSRREREIEEALNPLLTSQICIQSALVDADIRIHIRERLQHDAKLIKWPENVRVEIEEALVHGAEGMFRWVACQLDALRKCLKLNTLRKTLKSLPKTLDDTYTRILCSIDKEYSQDAFKILQWLTYSARPLRIEEVAEVIAVDTDGDGRFDLDRRLREPQDVLTICSGLVTTAVSRERDSYHYKDVVELRLAHFSVKEYLISDSVHTGYCIAEYADKNMAQTCLTYLLHFKGPFLPTFDEFPLIKYAARYWTQHYRMARNNTDQLNRLGMQLLETDAFLSWIRVSDPERPWSRPSIKRNIASPLYYASLEGLDELVRQLLKKGVNVNAQGGHRGNALCVASNQGYKGIVRMLLENGADINAQGGYYGNALQAASARGSKEIVQMLLEKGADINVQGGSYGNALQAASARGYKEIVQMLLEKGADINAQGGYYGNALQAASACGSKEIVQMLLENGADINAQGGLYGNALQAASACDYKEIVQMLLEKGADINAQGGHYT